MVFRKVWKNIYFKYKLILQHFFDKTKQCLNLDRLWQDGVTRYIADSAGLDFCSGHNRG